MQVSEQPILRDLVLVGGGHSHVVVLRMLAMQPESGLRITLICTDIDTPYSGMLPGYISGHYSFDEVHIDLGRLASKAIEDPCNATNPRPPSQEDLESVYSEAL